MWSLRPRPSINILRVPGRDGRNKIREIGGRPAEQRCAKRCKLRVYVRKTSDVSDFPGRCMVRYCSMPQMKLCGPLSSGVINAITTDCAKNRRVGGTDQCGAHWPDLVKVFVD